MSILNYSMWWDCKAMLGLYSRVVMVYSKMVNKTQYVGKYLFSNTITIMNTMFRLSSSGPSTKWSSSGPEDLDRQASTSQLRMVKQIFN